MSALGRAGGFLLVALVLVPSHAGTKPTVDVDFKVSHYTTDFTADQRNEMGSALARHFAERLTEEFGFLTFTSGAAQPKAKLIIDLAPPNSATLEVGFTAKIDGVPDAPGSVYWPFRAATAAGAGVEQQPAFVRAVQIELGKANFGDIAILLASVPIVGEGATLKADQESFLLKMDFEEIELCMDQNTVLKVQHLIPRGDQGRFTPVELIAKTFSIVELREDRRMVHVPGPVQAEVSSGQDDLEKLRQAEAERVLIGVFYVVDYQRFDEPDVCDRVISPEDAFGGGS